MFETVVINAGNNTFSPYLKSASVNLTNLFTAFDSLLLKSCVK